MNKKVKKTIGWIVYIAILVGLVFGVPKLLVKVLDTEYPMASITSGSMWPSLKKGDLVVIKGVDDRSEISVGDIVVYKNDRGFTIHRVEKMNQDTLITKGDANNISDKPIEYEKVIGKALTYKNKIVKIPKLGHIGLLVGKVKANGN